MHDVGLNRDPLTQTDYGNLGLRIQGLSCWSLRKQIQ